MTSKCLYEDFHMSIVYFILHVLKATSAPLFHFHIYLDVLFVFISRIDKI